MLNCDWSITPSDMYAKLKVRHNVTRDFQYYDRACVGHRYRRSSEAAASARLGESSVQVTTAESDGGEDRGLTGRGVYERERERERGGESESGEREGERQKEAFTRQR